MAISLSSFCLIFRLSPGHPSIDRPFSSSSIPRSSSLEGLFEGRREVLGDLERLDGYLDGGDALPTLSETSLLSARAAVQAVVEAELALSAAQVRVYGEDNRYQEPWSTWRHNQVSSEPCTASVARDGCFLAAGILATIAKARTVAAASTAPSAAGRKSNRRQRYQAANRARCRDC